MLSKIDQHIHQIKPARYRSSTEGKDSHMGQTAVAQTFIWKIKIHSISYFPCQNKQKQ